MQQEASSFTLGKADLKSNAYSTGKTAIDKTRTFISLSRGFSTADCGAP